MKGCFFIKRVIAMICFLSLMFNIFCSLTYMMRGNNGDTIRGLYSEPEDTIDVLCVGASSVYEYFTPLKAYHDYGFTSYDFASGGMDAELYPFMIEEGLKTQSPKIILVDVRKLLSTEHDDDIGAYFRNGSDAMNLSVNRLRAIHYFCNLNGVSDKDALSTYIDIIYYHGNYDRLGEESAWSFIDNTEADKKKGSITPRPYVHFYDKPQIDTAEIAKLPDTTLRVLNDIIDVCGDAKTDLVLTASPYLIDKDSQKELNAMAQIADDNGVPFLDFNGKYDLIPVAFERDFRNSRHFNVLGMEKYTDFICSYLTENYNLPDHRQDENYTDWNEKAEWYVGVFEDKKEECLKKISEIETCEFKLQKLKATTKISEWGTFSRDDNYTVFVVGKGTNDWDISIADIQALEYIGITEEMIRKGNFIGIYKGSEFDYSDTDTEKSGDAGDRTELGDGEEISYLVTNEWGPAVIIEGIEYHSPSEEGIYFILISNYQLNVEDVLLITCEDDELLLNHYKQQ